MKTSIFFILTGLTIITSCQPVSKNNADFRPLFNGKNLQGWETYIGVPDSSINIPGLKRNEKGKFTEPIGLNKDPLGIFSVVEEDGKPAIRVSGQINGALATTEEFGNYHLRIQVKWSRAKWPPVEAKLRNSGLLYHGTGNYGAGLGVWKNSHEYQLMETMMGDSYRMGDTYCIIHAVRDENTGKYRYDPDGLPVEFGEGKEGGKICSKSVTNEKPAGEWNTLELICYGDTSIHIVNGVVNMMITDSHLETDNKSIPLRKGNIQLQSEGAEVYFRNVEIREIDRIPQEYL